MTTTQPATSGPAFDDDAYSRFFGLKKTAERRWADDLVKALAQVDRALLPPAATHPLAEHIAEGVAAIPALLALVEGDDPRARFDGLDALAHVLLATQAPPPEASKRLRAVLAKEKDPQMLALLAKTLAIGRDEALLVEETKRLGDDDPAIVASAARLLGLGRWRPAVPVLKGLVSPERLYESRHVIWALGEIGDPDALPALEIALANAFRVVDCLIAIGKIGRVTSIPRVTPHLVSSFPEQKDAAARALAMILDENRALASSQRELKELLVPLIEQQLADPRAPLSGSTRFYMVLCLARLAHPLDPSGVRKYLGFSLDEGAAHQIATFVKDGPNVVGPKTTSAAARAAAAAKTGAAKKPPEKP